MKYNTSDFDNLLNEIAKEIERLKQEMNIHTFNHATNINTYNKLTTVYLQLISIK